MRTQRLIILYKKFFMRIQGLFNNSYVKIIPCIHDYYNFRFVVYFVHQNHSMCSLIIIITLVCVPYVPSVSGRITRKSYLIVRTQKQPSDLFYVRQGRRHRGAGGSHAPSLPPSPSLFCIAKRKKGDKGKKKKRFQPISPALLEGFLKDFAKFTENRPGTLLKKKL